MIAVHFMQYLEDNGFGVMQDSLWYGQLPLGDRYQDDDVNDIAVIESGGQLSRKGIRKQELEIWGRGANGSWPQMARRLQDIIDHFRLEYCPTLPPIATGCCADDGHVYNYVYVRPLSNVENLGVDDEQNMLYRIRVEVTYN
jgi:hypothetical protein